MNSLIDVFAIALIFSVVYLVTSLPVAVLVGIILGKAPRSALKFWNNIITPVFGAALVLWLGYHIVVFTLNAKEKVPNYRYPQSATDAAAVCMSENKSTSTVRVPGTFDAAGFISCMQSRGYRFIKDGVEVTPEQE